jgi:ATP-binding cassette subfamily B protein
VEHPEQLRSYFKMEWAPLTLVTVSGLLYNAGLTAGPYFEGQMAQRLFDILKGARAPASMAPLAGMYLLTILVVQAMRSVKRFYVRRFANDTARAMRRMLYNSLVHKSRAQLRRESVGAVMTRAVSDVDACAEGMRKFTTEVFDTGVALAAYLTMLFVYDWRLALLSCMFTPAAYLIASHLKTTVTRYGAAYKKSAGELSDATLDRVAGALTYRVYGREPDRDRAYEARLSDYERKAAAANLWENTMQPIYNFISLAGVVPLIWLGAKNVLGTGWKTWDIAAFTTFLACFIKLAAKSSSAAKLFNAVQRAQVSWSRIRPFMQPYEEPDTATELDFAHPGTLRVSHLSFAYPGGPEILRDVSFAVRPGEIAGVTGPVASGKSTLGRVFLCESPYRGNVRIGERELSSLSEYERSRLVSYLGHQPELMSDTLAENIRLGKSGDIAPYLRAACLEREAAEMPDGADTFAGSGGIRLSGGQQARTALCRTLYNAGAVLVLDDPFSAVDRGTARELLQNLRELSKDRAVLLISHRLELFPLLDQVLWMENGSCTASTHGELLEKNPAYARLFRAQEGGAERETKN